MKIVTVTLGAPGQHPERDGWVILNYQAPAGGRTSIGAYARRDAVWEQVAADLGNNLTRTEWPSFIKGNVRGNQLRLSCPNELDDVSFFAEFNPARDQSAPHELNPPFVKIDDENF